jgi:Ca2+-binding EF-hand superfamily protein
MSSQKQETFEGIDFDGLKEQTSLETDEIKVLKICFNMFDVKNVGFLSSDDLDDILRAMGFRSAIDQFSITILNSDS